MDLFSQMDGIIYRENGKIIGTPDEYYNGILVSDELRKVI